VERLQWQIQPGITDRIAVWGVEVHGVKIGDTGRAYAELVALGQRLGERHAGELIGSIEGIGEARALYKSFGVDPTRTRPSSEALLRRCLKGQDLYRINEAVDVGNWVSLEYLLPVGLYDRGRIEGDAAIVRTGVEAEEYEGIRKGPVHLAGRLCVADASGAFGSPTSDSLRTSIRDETRDLSAIVFAPAGIDASRLEAAARALADRLCDYCGGSEAEAFPV
jgi:DNA/RNA-binding domain of Phe-tRNA-synthetase-like protein